MAGIIKMAIIQQSPFQSKLLSSSSTELLMMWGNKTLDLLRDVQPRV
jgi:hypothetical protein